eukprot:Blabericola_migrator_1__144@NODE_1038_length_5633_cov_251_042041_g410_i1_p1_GENE_NODE_1038_length_5633_cov_251_042041_g410_i1NODE_1038_length_5633_cov_251_042041_g410_i1_p1_ORF_typecomplete_len881_score58_81_NODE_1038_length_5633_cov_251_042041_g410_i113874029
MVGRQAWYNNDILSCVKKHLTHEAWGRIDQASDRLDELGVRSGSLLELLHLNEQLSSLTAGTGSWMSTFDDLQLPPNAQSMTLAGREVLPPRGYLTCHFPSVPSGYYRVCISMYNVGDRRAYISVQSTQNRWLTSAFRRESLKIWDIPDSPTTFKDCSYWLTEPLSLTQTACVTLKLHRPASECYGESRMLPTKVKLLPDRHRAALESDIKPVKLRKLYAQHFPTLSLIKQHAMPHYRLTATPHRARCRALTVAKAHNVHVVGIFRNVPPHSSGRIKVLMRSFYAAEFSTSWVSWALFSRNLSFRELLDSDDPWVECLDRSDAKGFCRGLPQGNRAEHMPWDFDEAAPEAILDDDGTPFVRPLAISLPPENAVNLRSQCPTLSFDWMYFEGPRFRTEDINKDILVSFRFQLSCLPMHIDHFALVFDDPESTDEAYNDASTIASATPVWVEPASLGWTQVCDRRKRVLETRRETLPMLWAHVSHQDLISLLLLNRQTFAAATPDFVRSSILTRLRSTPRAGRQIFLKRRTASERLIRWAGDVPGSVFGGTINQFLCFHPHAARACTDLFAPLKFDFVLSAGHYRISCITYMQQGRDPTQVSVSPLFNSKKSEEFKFLSCQRVVYTEALLDGTCQQWTIRDTFTVLTLKSVRVTLSIPFDNHFEKLELLPCVTPCIEMPRLHSRPLGTFRWARAMRCMVAPPFLMSSVAMPALPNVTKGFFTCARTLSGQINLSYPDEKITWRAVLPAPIPGFYRVYVRVLLWTSDWDDALSDDDDSYSSTSIEIVTAVAATPRSRRPTLTTSAGILCPKIGPLYMGEGRTSVISCNREAVGIHYKTAREWHCIMSKRPIYVPVGDYQVYITLRLPPCESIRTETFGLVPDI